MVKSMGCRLQTVWVWILAQLFFGCVTKGKLTVPPGLSFLISIMGLGNVLLYRTVIFRWIYTCEWRRQWHPTPVLLPGKPHGRRSLAGCSPWGREESDTTERLHFHFSLLCTGEVYGSPLQRLAWRIPGTGSHRVGHDWSDLAAHTRVKRLEHSW